MAPGDDELREGCGGERVERDLRLPRAALDQSAPAPPGRARAEAGMGGSRRRADGCEEPPQECFGLARPRRTRRAPAPPRRRSRPRDRPRATRVAGGSITVSDRSASGCATAASSDTTPPYEWPTRWSPGARRSATSAASGSKSTRSTGGFGGKPGRSTTTSSNRSASGRCAGPRPASPDDASVDEDEPWHRLILRAFGRAGSDLRCNEVRQIPAV